MKIQVITPKTKNDYLDDILSLRVLVWEHQIGMTTFLDRRWLDEHDFHAHHWIVLNEDNSLMASARLCVHCTVSGLPDYEEIGHLLQDSHCPVAMMSRLVVNPAYQRLGIAKELDIARIEKAKQLDCNFLAAQVPIYRMRSIQALGFQCLGKAYEKTFQSLETPDFYLYVKDLRFE